jgi:hypothetical protein
MRFVTIASCVGLGAALLPILAGSLVSRADAGSQDDAKIVLHSQPWSSKNPCGGGADLVRQTPCDSYSVGSAPLQTATAVYLVVTGSPVSGLGGVQCGIDYDDTPGSGVDILNWITCGTLQFPSAGENGGWPSAGSGNRLIWSSCQDTIPDGESFAQAVAGVFYVYAYSDDALEITPDRTSTCYGELVITDCAANPSDLMPGLGRLGAAGFGASPGFNPCDVVVDGAICGVSERVLEFGTVLIGQSMDLTVRIQDVGFGLGLPTFDVLPLDGGDFSVVAGAGHYEEPVQSAVDVTFRFTPTSPGLQEISFEVEPCTLCPPVVLRGTGDTIVPVEPTRWGALKARYE